MTAPDKEPFAKGSDAAGNQRVLLRHAEKIRHLDDFEIVMLISEIHDHGWPLASKTLELMPTMDWRNHADD